MSLLNGLNAYFLVIDAHAEECFFDKVTTGTKLGLTFEVVEGGFLDIDVRITGKSIVIFDSSPTRSQQSVHLISGRDLLSSLRLLLNQLSISH